MHRYYRFTSLGGLIVVLSLVLGCKQAEVQIPRGTAQTTCFYGTVSYRLPGSPSPIPYPHARIGAWPHGAKKGLVETRANATGEYCLEVPLGDQTIDLRVWGLIRLEGTSYTCEGSQEDIDPRQIERGCNTGDCIRIDIVTDCREFEPPFHREM